MLANPGAATPDGHVQVPPAYRRCVAGKSAGVVAARQGNGAFAKCLGLAISVAASAPDQTLDSRVELVKRL